MTVDSAAQTVRIGLASAFANGDVLEFSYMDPTAGNDLNAIQDTNGVDAASFSASNQTNSAIVVSDSRPSAPMLALSSDSGTLGDNVTNLTTPIIAGTATANDTVMLYDGSTLIGQTTADGSGNWSISSTTLAEGVHTLTATQIDSSSNTSVASAALTLTIDTTAPAVSTPVLDAFSNSGSLADDITNFASPVIIGTTEAGSTVTLYDTDGTTALGSVTADAYGEYRITSSRLSDGVHSLTVRSVDAAGNVGVPSPAITVVIDTTAPMIGTPILDPSTNSGPLGANLTNYAAPVITGITDPGSLVTLYDSNGTTALGSVTADLSGHYRITSPTLTDGLHSLTVKAVDVAGNVSVRSPALTLTIDTVAPATSPLPVLDAASDSGMVGDGLTNTTTPTITGTADAGTIVILYDTDGTTVLGTGIADVTGSYSITSSTLSEGSHTLTVKSLDTAGNVSTASPALSLEIDSIAPAALLVAPALSRDSDSGVLGDGVTNVTTPTLTGTAEPGGLVTLNDGSTQIGTATANLNGAWSFTTGQLAAGAHQIAASVTDAAGNVSALSQPLALTIYTAAPKLLASLLNDTGSSATDRITADATLTGTSDPNAVITIAEGKVTLGTAVADGQGNWTFDPTGLSVGTHTLVASTVDNTGNTNTAQVTLRLDQQSANAPSDVMPVSDTAVSIVRFFDTTTGTHFYTSSQAEYNSVVATRPDLKMDGDSLTALNPNSVAGDPAAAPVYRFFDATYGTHFFTTDAGERDAVLASRPDLKFEGVGFFEHATQQIGDTAVYRFFDTKNGTHFYTASDTERASLQATRPDLTDEGIGFYAPKVS